MRQSSEYRQRLLLGLLLLLKLFLRFRKIIFESYADGSHSRFYLDLELTEKLLLLASLILPFQSLHFLSLHLQLVATHSGLLVAQAEVVVFDHH